MGLFNVKEENLAAAAGALSLSLSFLSLIPWVPSCKFQFQWRLRLLYYMAATESERGGDRRILSLAPRITTVGSCCVVWHVVRPPRTAPFAYTFPNGQRRHETRPSGVLFYEDVIKRALGTGRRWLNMRSAADMQLQQQSPRCSATQIE